ncbi:methylated-DNA--[protein]-cysteine S-methyltransferase [Vallicoccus soli]|uniref:methylated-DNA--[protein]-cysteine S-methyltransferase n=1 Tax=Vallicoccus soli TaxID=2339232 RepID=UPI001FE285FA|nr:methylated-DNA--[protein]-cysteine S-methyltransferase [Vallicoccus soli]
MTTTWTTVLPSPVGDLLVAAGDDGLRAVLFTPHRHPPADRGTWRSDDAHPVLRTASEQLAAYFAGDLRAFDLPLAPRGSAFQLRVWEALRSIPYGGTASYGDLARRLGAPGAARAVGLANGRNPLSIVVPCHRVVGARGTLTGYAGGLERKRALLDLEAGALVL